jgi:hypothetical protein
MDARNLQTRAISRVAAAGPLEKRSVEYGPSFSSIVDDLRGDVERPQLADCRLWTKRNGS